MRGAMRAGERLHAIADRWEGGRVARELNQVGVVGLGTMGAGITEVMARAGLSVTAVEVTADPLERGRTPLQSSTDRAVKRGKLDPAERDRIFQRIRFTPSLEDLADA